ncbi:PTS sugar transporter subunit IIA [Spiroplasma taiwanense]|uniref:PTS sugar transporter subunit IIA n=1 Tax=Spiroplasma taiwanense TaxID=2145 RepID=UPI000A0649C1
MFLNQNFNNKEEVLKDIFKKFENEGINSFYINSILEREKISSFNIGNNIAIPHGTYEGMQVLEKSIILFYHLKNSIFWVIKQKLKW